MCERKGGEIKDIGKNKVEEQNNAKGAKIKLNST